ncbi:MAG: tetratricopeptide repeat protein [Burkholderiales bacterium]|nr:tetratricopeptide repeat protein [Burkholderiales bacterium]
MPAALQRALAWHRAGRLDEAERAYRDILRAWPDQFDAHHYLGVLAWQRGRLADADALLARARRINPDVAEASANHAGVLRDMGRGGEALASCDQALARKPDVAQTHYLRATILQALNRPDSALASYDRALALDPAFVDAYNERAGLFRALKRHAEALRDCDRVLALAPQAVAAQINRGGILRELGRFPEALASYDAARAQAPALADAHCGRGSVQNDLRRHDEALASFDQALRSRPRYAAAHCGRAAALSALNRHREALASSEHALAIDPQLAEALNNRGVALAGLGRDDDALASYEQALRLEPSLATALHNRAACLQHAHRHAEAVEAFARALAVEPTLPYARGMMLHARMHCCDWRGLAAEIDALRQSVRSGQRAASPFVFLTVADAPDEQLACARIWVADRCPLVDTAYRHHEPRRHDRIRLAYLSSDLQEHATAYLAAGVIEAHDPRRFETIALSFGPDATSPMRSRLRDGVTRFIDVRERSDAEVAQLMRSLEIDIAVDLKGHTTDSRPGIFARRGAPVQVNYLGYPGTTGAPYIDYIVADDVVVPPAAQAHYSERVVYLPGSYQANDARRRIATQVPSRADAGLPERGFVFCSFNSSYKITPPVFASWMRLLQAVDGSVLWLLDCNAAATANLRREAQAHGVDAGRLVFAPKQPVEMHLARHRLADLFLDTMPVNAHTTASDALWAGLPIVTCPGAAFAGRVAASLLRAAGLPELVMPSLLEYEAHALRLATDAALLQRIRQKLERQLPTCALFDTDRFRRQLEAAYVRMWQRSQAGAAPTGFAVAPDLETG